MDLRDQLQQALGTAYRIERELGQGGMSTVFLAEDLKHQRKVAVKVLRPELAAALGPDRFTREIRFAARLQHPHILPLLDSGESQGFLWYAYIVVSADTVPFQTMWSVPIDGSVPRPLIHFDDPLATFGRGTFAAHDSTIYFALLRSESDVWVAELGEK